MLPAAGTTKLQLLVACTNSIGKKKQRLKPTNYYANRPLLGRQHKCSIFENISSTLFQNPPLHRYRYKFNFFLI